MRAQRRPGPSWWCGWPSLEACWLTATGKEPDARECPQPVTCLSQCEGTSVARGQLFRGPESALKRMWVTDCWGAPLPQGVGRKD